MRGHSLHYFVEVQFSTDTNPPTHNFSFINISNYISSFYIGILIIHHFVYSGVEIICFFKGISFALSLLLDNTAQSFLSLVLGPYFYSRVPLHAKRLNSFSTLVSWRCMWYFFGTRFMWHLDCCNWCLLLILVKGFMLNWFLSFINCQMQGKSSKIRYRLGQEKAENVARDVL